MTNIATTKTSVFTDKEATAIRSMGLYWREVRERDNPGDILQHEVAALCQQAGTKVLWAVLAYVEERHG